MNSYRLTHKNDFYNFKRLINKVDFDFCIYSLILNGVEALPSPREFPFSVVQLVRQGLFVTGSRLLVHVSSSISTEIYALTLIDLQYSGEMLENY